MHPGIFVWGPILIASVITGLTNVLVVHVFEKKGWLTNAVFVFCLGFLYAGWAFVLTSRRTGRLEGPDAVPLMLRYVTIADIIVGTVIFAVLWVGLAAYLWIRGGAKLPPGLAGFFLGVVCGAAYTFKHYIPFFLSGVWSRVEQASSSAATPTNLGALAGYVQTAGHVLVGLLAIATFFQVMKVRRLIRS